MKRKPWLSSHTGSDAESLVTSSLENLNYRFTKEKIAHSKSTAKTSKGLFDYRVHLADCDHCIEVKSRQTSISIPNGVNRNPNIKPHQLKALREERAKGNKVGLLLNYRLKNSSEWIYLSLESFDKLILDNYPVNSINYQLAQSYGVSIGIKNDILDLSVVIEL